MGTGPTPHPPPHTRPQFDLGVDAILQGQYDDSVRYFNVALELDPKDANQIKVALDNLLVDDVEGEPEL